jgi:hypothetical protein
MMDAQARTIRRAALALVLGALLLPGCGYSLAGRGSFLPDYIRTIGVPNFTNNTAVFNIEQTISDRVRSELAGRGKYKVFPEATGVDGLLLGEIQSISLVPAAFTDQRLASRFVLTITTKIEFKDVKADKVLWSSPAMQFREEYDVPNATAALDPGTFLGQDQNAMARLSAEFARTIVSAILEAF